jgi:hypothetical protein
MTLDLPNLFTIMEYYKSCLKRSKQKDETIKVKTGRTNESIIILEATPL